MILTIVIPYYKESPRVLFPLLATISTQVGVDFNNMEVLLVNDGAANALSDKFLGQFALPNIRCVLAKENKGPGVTRQLGIDHAKGEYVIFCDADDILHSVAVLGVFIKEIEEHRPDIICSPFLEELIDKDRYIYLNHEDEITWMFGKAFRRIYLQTKNIRFHEKLRVHEDSYFLGQAWENTTNIRKLLVTTYVWKFKPDSITRLNDGAYTYDAMPLFFESMGELFKILPKEKMPYKVVQLIMYAFFSLHLNHWNTPENKDRLQAAEYRFAEVLKPYLDYYKNSQAEFIGTVYNQERAKIFGGHIERENLGDWMKRIGL